MQIKQIGIDIGKNNFPLVGLGTAGDIVLPCRRTDRSSVSLLTALTRRDTSDG